MTKLDRKILLVEMKYHGVMQDWYAKFVNGTDGPDQKAFHKFNRHFRKYVECAKRYGLQIPDEANELVDAITKLKLD